MRKSFKQLREIPEEVIVATVVRSVSFADLARKLGMSTTTRNISALGSWCRQGGVNTDHFVSNGSRKKYPIIEKECPVCNKAFQTSLGSPKEKTVCSNSCANTYFKSGINHPNWKDDTYRSTCFLYHAAECVICKEHRIVEVHHLDANRKNNKPENLIPLCPTHHKYWHYGYRDLIEEQIMEYVEKFKQRLD